MQRLMANDYAVDAVTVAKSPAGAYSILRQIGSGRHRTFDRQYFLCLLNLGANKGCKTAFCRLAAQDAVAYGIITGMKTKRSIIAAAVIMAVVAIWIIVLVLRTCNTAAVPVNETAVEKKVVKKTPVKKTSVPARAKQVKASPAKAAKPESARPVSAGTAKDENAVEKPKEDAVAQAADKDTKPDNPFPRYLDMFRNDPAALVAEFEKEAEADRANQRKMRDKAIAKLKLNAEQAALFEKALDDIRSGKWLSSQADRRTWTPPPTGDSGTATCC